MKKIIIIIYAMQLAAAGAVVSMDYNNANPTQLSSSDSTK
jgi:hypothetical protein